MGKNMRLENKTEAVIDIPCILIKINKSFRNSMSAVELYDATRSAWPLGLDREKALYAFAVYKGIVQEVYKIAGWFKNKSTFNTRRMNETNDSTKDKAEERWEFVGDIADEEIRNKYLLKDVSEYQGPRFPVDYVNIKKQPED